MSDQPDFDPETFASLEREAPVLSRVKRFADGLEGTNWFENLGEAPTKAVRALSQDYLDALGFPEAALAILPTWEDATDAAETYDFAAPAWEAEELARADLTATALGMMSEEALAVGLAVVAEAIGESAKAAMEEQAAYWDVFDEPAQNLAVGAVAQAAHSATLLLMAAAADPEIEVASHHVAHKFKLFEHGRWPVAVVGGTFSLF